MPLLAVYDKIRSETTLGGCRMTERESDKEKLRDQLFSVLYQAGVHRCVCGSACSRTHR